jgi:hypothetical protein
MQSTFKVRKTSPATNSTVELGATVTPESVASLVHKLDKEEPSAS